MAPTSGDALEPTALEYGKTDHTVHHETKHPVIGDLTTLDAGYNESDIIADLPPAEGKKALRKVDIRLVPLLAVSGNRGKCGSYIRKGVAENEIRCCIWSLSSTGATCRRRR
jgi:hypothetical protein